MIAKILGLALAGGCGSLARYWLSGIVQRQTTFEFPLGTAVVNIVGCLLFGLVWAFAENHLSVSSQWRTVIFVGFFGAFTTFSSFAFETTQLMTGSQWMWAMGNIVLQNTCGVAAVLTGLAVGKFI
jgi:CrcB protein